MIKISEVGVSRRQVLRCKSPKPYCSKNVLSASSLDIYEFAPHLILLLLGMMLAVLMYVVEAIKYKYINNIIALANKLF